MASKITEWLQGLIGGRKETSQNSSPPPERQDDIVLRDEQGAEVRGGAKPFSG